MRILELAADLDRVRLGGGLGGAERDQSILHIAERINLCRRGCDDGVDVNKARSSLANKACAAASVRDGCQA